MIVSSQDVKQFLLDLIKQANYPGAMLDFVLSVRSEVADASISTPQDVGGEDHTASDRMMSHKAGS